MCNKDNLISLFVLRQSDYLFELLGLMFMRAMVTKYGHNFYEKGDNDDLNARKMPTSMLACLVGLLLRSYHGVTYYLIGLACLGFILRVLGEEGPTDTFQINGRYI